MRNEKESHVRENSLYIPAQKKEKNDSLEGVVRKRAETEGKECWKKERTGGCGAPLYPTPRGRKTKRKMGFCGLWLEKEMEEKRGKIRKTWSRDSAFVSFAFGELVFELWKTIPQCRPKQNMHTDKNFVFVSVKVLHVVHQRWSPRGRPWPREHILKSLASKPQVLGLEALGPRKLPCPRLEDSTIFWTVEILLKNARNLAENLQMPFLFSAIGA